MMMYSNMSIVNTIAVPGYDGCHYSKTGYDNLAARVLPVVNRDFYGITPTESVTPPNLLRAWFTTSGRTAIALKFDQPMSWSGFSLPNWHVNDAAGQVTSGGASGDTITLQLAGIVPATEADEGRIFGRLSASIP